jgi:hypothetical protein
MHVIANPCLRVWNIREYKIYYIPVPLSLLPRSLDIIYTYNNRPSSKLSSPIFWDNPRFPYLVPFIKVSPNQVILREGNRKNMIYCYFCVLVFVYIKDSIPVYIKLEKVSVF